MATSKSGSSTSNGRDSRAQRLGCKIFGGASVRTGMIIMRQRGTAFHPGRGSSRAGDDSIFAMKDGVVSFRTGLKGRTFIDVI